MTLGLLMLTSIMQKPMHNSSKYVCMKIPIFGQIMTSNRQELAMKFL
jgi:hypothetical protein